MNVRNRMADVEKLRCNACQDFLKLIVQEGWQQSLYIKARDEVEVGRFRDKYIAAYEKMREVGIENYRIEDMDVTIMSEVLRFCPGIAKINKETKKSIKELAIDRNVAGHSNENEESEELYSRAHSALRDLQVFIKNVDTYETSIDDAERQSFRNKYSTKIIELMKLLDEERISLVQRIKDIDHDIQKIINSQDRLKTWCSFNGEYMNRYFNLEKSPEKYYEFIVRASNAGIREAHDQAAMYFFYNKHDNAEAEKRLSLLFTSYDIIPAGNAKSIIDLINEYLREGNEITNGMITLVNGIIEQGYPVVQNDEGSYVWQMRQR